MLQNGAEGEGRNHEETEASGLHQILRPMARECVRHALLDAGQRTKGASEERFRPDPRTNPYVGGIEKSAAPLKREVEPREGHKERAWFFYCAESFGRSLFKTSRKA